MVLTLSEEEQSSFGSFQSISMSTCGSEAGGGALQPLEDPLFVRYLVSLGIDVTAAREDPAALEDYACEFAWSRIAGASPELLEGNERTHEERALLGTLSNGKRVGERDLYLKQWENVRSGEAEAWTSLCSTSDGSPTNPSKGKEVWSQVEPWKSTPSGSPMSAVGSVLAHPCLLGSSASHCATSGPLSSAGECREFGTPSIGEGETTVNTAEVGCGDDSSVTESWSMQCGGETKRRKMTWEGANLTTLV